LKIGVLGATGFIGGHILNFLSQEGFLCIGFSRSFSGFINDIEIKLCSFDDNNFNWLDLDFDVLIDCADPPHIQNSISASSDFVQSTISHKKLLMAFAFRYGVKHYVYLSSAKIFGECSYDLSFNEETPPNPSTSYAHMKLAIEKVLQKESDGKPLVLSILRIPFVYGNNGGGSLLALSNILKTGLWLPFKGVENQRSFLAVSNLSSFLLSLIRFNGDKSGIWCLSSDESFSTSQLFSMMSSSLGLKVVLFSFPKIFINVFFTVFGKKDLYSKLFENFVVDDSVSRHKLNWSPSECDSQLLMKFFKDNQ